MIEKLNLSFKTTAGYSIWTNGIVEHHNAILTEIIKKVKRKKVISWKTTTNWAVNAKNCLVNRHGFSLYNIINRPSILEDKTIGDVMKRHFTDLQETRKTYLEA